MKLELGVPREEAALKRGGHEWPGGWSRPQLVSFIRSSTGAVIIASVPVGSDMMLGQRCEIWLFPDATYSAEVRASWLGGMQGVDREGRHYKKGKEDGVRDGCHLHPSCFECPEKDCVL